MLLQLEVKDDLLKVTVKQLARYHTLAVSYEAHGFVAAYLFVGADALTYVG